MFSNEVLSVNTRRGIGLTGIALGLLWYCSDNSGMLYAGFTASIFIRALCISCAAVLMLSVQRFNSKRLWGVTGAVALLSCIMAAWVNWNLAGEYVTFAAQFSVTNFLGWLLIFNFFLVPWIQYYLSQDEPGAGYRNLNRNLWLNGITILLSLFILGIAWSVLWLWATLFYIIDITFFRELFIENNCFQATFTSFILAIAIVICRCQLKIIEAIKNFFTLLARVLFPLLAFIALLFLAMLPFVGLNHVTERVSSAGTLSTLALLIMMLAWIMGTSSRTTPNWNKAFTYLVRLSMVILPLFTLIAAWALGIRVHQYGWSPLRVDGALTILTLTVAGFGVSLQTIRCRNACTVNVNAPTRLFLIMAAAMFFISHTPIIDPLRISVNAHMARYHSGEIKADDVSIAMLEDAGRRGHDAIKALKKDKDFMSSEMRSALINDALNPRIDISESITVVTLQGVTEVAKGSVIPETWWAWVVNEWKYSLDECYRGNNRCMIKSLDLNGDKLDEIMLCDVAERTCSFFALKDKDEWSVIGYSMALPKALDSEKFRKSIQGNKLELKPKEWKNLVIDGETMIVNYQDR
ncbi:DUF4153 domain-containing protein [Atlantibacter sp.]|uniref:DUF4153 domain-containing protein n=1 Tax=Atlantibacter sp. TaxID=1903473 RepID=UPI0028A7EDAA|nr:DUF4153 domain-containing protein [Atlantibacter sp.]